MKYSRNVRKSVKRAYKSSSKGKVRVAVPVRVKPKTRAVIQRIATTAAKRVMNRSEETKCQYVANSLIKFNSAINSTGDLLNVIPSPISRGTASSQRIGNKIIPTRMIIEGHCFAAPDNSLGLQDAVVPPIEVTMYLIRPKNLRTFTELTVSDTNFLQTPTGSTNYDGSLTNSILPVDKTNYELIAKRRFVLAAPASSFANTGAAVTNAGMVAIPNGSTIAKRFKISFRPKGNWEYNESDSTGNHPANQCYFMACGYTYLQNYAADTTSVKFQMQYNTTLYYKDS